MTRQMSSEGFSVQNNCVVPHQSPLSANLNSDENLQHVTDTECVYMNSDQLLAILQTCELNWLDFVLVLQHMRSTFREEALEEHLFDFAPQLPFLGLSIEDQQITEQSSQGYLLSQTLQGSGSHNSV